MQAYQKWVNAELKGLKVNWDNLDFKDLYEEYQQLIWNVHNKKSVQKRAYLEEIKTNFRKEQPVKDVQRQLNEFSVNKEEADDVSVTADDYLLSEHVHSISLLLIFIDSENSSLKIEKK